MLSDGGTMAVRPIRPDDAERIVAFHERQSPESIYFRFFSPRPRLSERDLERFTRVDYVDRMAFVGLIGDDLVGVARYDRHRARSDAEVAFFIDDAHHGRGMATVLLEYLAAAAREVGHLRLHRVGAARRTARCSACSPRPASRRRAGSRTGSSRSQLDIEPTPEALAAIEDRAGAAEARSVERLLRPTSIAVIGASRTPGHHRPPGVPPAGEPRLPGAGVPGQPRRPTTWPASGPGGRCSTSPASSTWRSSACPADRGAAGGRGVRVQAGAGAGRAVRGVRRPRRGGRGGRDRAGRPTPAATACGCIGPNAPRHHQHRPGRLDARHVRAASTRSPGASGWSPSRASIGAAIIDSARQRRAWASPRSWPSATRPTSPATTSSGTGRTTRTPTWSCATWSRSATRRSSAAPPGTCRSDKPVVAVKVGGSPADRWEEPEGWPPDATAAALLEQTGIVRVDNLTQMFHTAGRAGQPAAAGAATASPCSPTRGARRGSRSTRSRRPGLVPARARRPVERGRARAVHRRRSPSVYDVAATSTRCS